MRFYTKTHKHYCGIDPHARSMYVCVMNHEGQVLLHRGLPCDPVRFLMAIRPYRSNRTGVGEGFEDGGVNDSLAADLALTNHYELVIQELEVAVLRQARGHDPNSFQLLRSVPGIGRVLALTILYEIHDIHRFGRVQEFASYCRLVKCQQSSAGKVTGTGGAKIGNAYLKWAFSEAAVLFLAKCPQGKALFARIERKHGKGKALSILAHKLGRAVYFMLTRKRAFDLDRFLRS
jgi:hypothetical protein